MKRWTFFMLLICFMCGLAIFLQRSNQPAGTVSAEGADLLSSELIAPQRATYLAPGAFVPIALSWRASQILVSCDGPQDDEMPWYAHDFDDQNWSAVILPDVRRSLSRGHSDRFYRASFLAEPGWMHLNFWSDDGLWV